MEIGIIQVLLIGVVGFIGGIDQFSFLESLYQPIVLGPIVGAILGNLDMGLKIGASYQLMSIGSMPIGGAQPPNAVLGGIMATVFAITLNRPDFESALGLAIPFGLLGQQAVNIWFTVASPVMTKMDHMSAEADVKGVERWNLIMMFGIGVLFAVIAMIGAYAGAELGTLLSEIVPDQVWAGFNAAGGMMKFVGFAVLMKVMMSGEFWTVLIAGFALANVVDNAFAKLVFDAETGLATGLQANGAYTLVIMAIIGAALAFYDFQINTKINATANKAKEDYSDGI